MVKLALVCPTVGQTRRGYERFVTDLFTHVRSDLDAVLFKGKGESRPDEIVVPHLRRTGILARLPSQRLRYLRYRLEYASFAMALMPHLARGKFDIVHFIDPPLGPPLAAFRRRAAKPCRLLFTDGGPMSFDASRFADRIHCLTPAAREAIVAAGTPAERVKMLPAGVDPAPLRRAPDRDVLRARLGVAPETFVLLAVTTLNRQHKRVDYLIDEVARLRGDVLLWIDAGLHPDGDPGLLDLAAARLSGRFRHSHVASDRVGELYRLADALVSTSLQESFGMSIVEAMCAGLPVVTHDSAHFRWLVGDRGHFVDMTVPGCLAAKLAQLIGGREVLRREDDTDGVLRRFGWAGLKPAYLDLYRGMLDAHA